MARLNDEKKFDPSGIWMMIVLVVLVEMQECSDISKIEQHMASQPTPAVKVNVNP